MTIFRRVLGVLLVQFFLSLLSSVHAESPTVKPRRIAILVGAQEFSQAFPGGRSSGGNDALPALKWTAHDVVRMATVLLDSRLGHFDQVYLLTRRQYLKEVADSTQPARDEALQRDLPDAAQDLLDLLDAGDPRLTLESPTQSVLLERLAKLNGRVSEADSLLLYFATHGAIRGEVYVGSYLPEERMMLMLEDGRSITAEKPKSQSSTARRASVEILTLANVLTAMSRLPARHKVLIEDTCHSAMGQKAYRGSGDTSGQSLNPSYRTVLMTSSAPGQSAVELEELQGGLYTHALVRALQAPLDGRDPSVTIEKAHSAVKHWMRSWFACQAKSGHGYGSEQTPGFFDAQVGDPSPLVLAGSAPTPLDDTSMLLEAPEMVPCDALSKSPVALRRQLSPGLTRLPRDVVKAAFSPFVWLKPGEELRPVDLRHVQHSLALSLAPGVSTWRSPAAPEVSDWNAASLELGLTRALLTTPRERWTLDAQAHLRLMGSTSGGSEYGSSESQWFTTGRGLGWSLGLASRWRLATGPQLSVGASAGSVWLELPAVGETSGGASVWVPVHGKAPLIELRSGLAWSPHLMIEGVPWLSWAWRGARPDRWSLELIAQGSLLELAGEQELSGTSVSIQTERAAWGMGALQFGWSKRF